MKKIVVLTALLALTGPSNAYRRSDFAFAFIGGQNSVYGKPGHIPDAIRAAYPDIPFVELKIGDGSPAATQAGMYEQVTQVYEFAKNEQTLKDKHVILMGGSQGGLVAQALIEMYGDKVPFVFDSLMTYVSPLAGQYGLPYDWEPLVTNAIQQGSTPILQEVAKSLGIKDIPIAIKDNRIITVGEALNPKTSVLSKEMLDTITNIIKIPIRDGFEKNDYSIMRYFFYNPIALKKIALAGYWRDPLHQDEYLKGNGFLPLINNEIKHPDADRYKKNISALNWVVFLWAAQDNVIKPPRSAIKCSYKWGSKTDVEEFTETDQYQKDLLGLKNKYENGHLILDVLEHTNHSCSTAQASETALRHINTLLRRS